MHVSIHPPSIHTHTHNDPFSQNDPPTTTVLKALNLYQTNVVKMLTNFGKVVRKDNIKQPWGERLRHWTSDMLSSNFSTNTLPVLLPIQWYTDALWWLDHSAPHLVKIRPAYQHVYKLFPLGQRWARHASNHFTNRGSKSPNDPPNCFQARLSSALCTC